MKGRLMTPSIRQPAFRPSRLHLLTLLTSAAVLGGCASFSPDGGFSAIEKAARDHLGKDVQWARTDADRDRIDQRVAELLAKPLTMDDAVQVALLNNRGLQATYAELGITEAEVVQAGRLPNPGFSFGRLTRGSEVEFERGLHFNLARLIALPFIGQMEARRFEQTKAMAAMSVLALAADTRKAWVNALAAEESVRYMRQVRQAAEASSELARRMAQVGNFNKLQRAREQVFYADASLNLARAEQSQRATRERLTRLLGAWGAQTQFALPDRLPDLPKGVTELPDIERVALGQRLDVQGARLAAERTARNLGLTKTTRFINVLELGVLRKSSNETPTQSGWEISIELPLFDWSGARVARAEAIYMQTVRYMRQVMQAANASAELARRMEQVGNFNKLQRAREQVFYADASLNFARAEQAQRATRERLTRLLGAWGTQTQFSLPERLPDLPKDVTELPDIERVALAQRLDVQGAKLAAEQTARNLGLTRATRFVNVLELGLIRNSSNEEPTQRGWEIGFELPLFDWGGARVARAEAVYMQTVHRAAETAINARSEVREAYTGYRSAYDIARHQRDEVVPLNQRIAEENVLRYNGMLIGVFELLADARAQIASVNNAIESLRDFWIAQADLDMALIGKPSLAIPGGPAIAAEPGGAAH